MGRTVAITRTISYVSIPLASMTGGYLLQKGTSFNVLVTISAFVLLATFVISLFTPFASSKRKVAQFEVQIN